MMFKHVNFFPYRKVVFFGRQKVRLNNFGYGRFDYPNIVWIHNIFITRWWWFQTCCMFTPHPWGNDPIWLARIFQMGWFNHHLDNVGLFDYFFVTPPKPDYIWSMGRIHEYLNKNQQTDLGIGDFIPKIVPLILLVSAFSSKRNYFLKGFWVMVVVSHKRWKVAYFQESTICADAAHLVFVSLNFLLSTRVNHH